MLPQSREGPANTPTLPNDENNDLTGLHPNTTAAEPPLAEGEQDQDQNGIRSPLRRPTATPALTVITRTGIRKPRSQGPGHVNAGTDDCSPAIGDDQDENGGEAPPPHGSSEARLGEEDHELMQGADPDVDRNRSHDEHSPSSLEGSEAEQDEDIGEEDDERTPAPKRKKANRDPSEAEPLAKPMAKPKLRRRGNKVRHRVLRSAHMLSVDLGNEGAAEQHSDDQDGPRRRPAHPRHDGPWMEDEEGEESDDNRPPPLKRREATSLAKVASLRTRRHRHTRDAASGRRTVFSSRSSQSSINGGNSQVPRGMFEGWPLGNVVLKRVTADGLATFQLQFTWDPCAKHGTGHHGTENRSSVSSAKRHHLVNRGG